MKKLVIIRGVSGSGKTTVAKSIIMMHPAIKPCFHYEADMWFTQDDGSYQYDPAQIKNAHQWCQLAVEKAMRSISKSGTVIVSNTFTRKWEYEHYLTLAQIYKFEVEVIVCEGNFKNVHGVPDDIVQKMKERFEE